MHEYKSMLFKNQKDVDPKCPTWVDPVKPLYLTIDLFSTYYCITISLIHLCWRTRASSAAPVAKLLRLISSDSVTGLDLKAASSHSQLVYTIKRAVLSLKNQVSLLLQAASQA